MSKFINNVKVENNYVIKKYNKNIIDVYKILDSSSFDNYPKIIEYDNNSIKYEYIKSIDFLEKTNGEEFIKIVSMLHYKTLFFKDVNKSKYEKIYNKIIGNINYLSSYYRNMLDSIELEEYMSPSHYLFCINYSLIDSSLKYSKSQINKWYNKVKNKDSERVCVVHNNLSLNHFIKSKDKCYLVSFDNSMIDSPVLDLYKFYRNEGYKLKFDYLFEIYNNELNLLDEEKKLFYSLISLPFLIKENDNEYTNTIIVNNLINYLSITAKFINKNNNLQV